MPAVPSTSHTKETHVTTLHDFAPYPSSEEDATVEAMARNALVSSWANSALAHNALRENHPHTDQLAAALHEAATEQFDVAWLLTELAAVAPERAAEVAQQMWRQRFDGAVIHELTWQRLTAAGIDPDQVTDAVTRAVNGKAA